MDQRSQAHQLIEELLNTQRVASPHEIELIKREAAAAGFDRTPEPARGRLASILFDGRFLQEGDPLPAVAVRYLWHAVKRQEWPWGTTLAQFEQSVCGAITAADTAVFLNHYQGATQAGFVAPSGAYRGSGGGEWIVAEYRVSVGHIITAYQVDEGLGVLDDLYRKSFTWLVTPEESIASRPG